MLMTQLSSYSLADLVIPGKFLFNKSAALPVAEESDEMNRKALQAGQS